MDNLTFALFVFVLVFPFGFWRAKSVFKSRDWMLAIHIPVVFIIIMRIINKVYFHIGFQWISVVYNLAAFMTSQYLAGIIYKKFLKKKNRIRQD